MRRLSRNKDFILKIEEISHQSIADCYQCGRCTAGCPFAEFMDEPPNRIIRYIQLGLRDDVLKAQSPWFCAACLVCETRCPRGVDIPRIMEAVRTVHLRAKEQIIDIDMIDKELLMDTHPLLLMSALYKYSY
ncbi:MAG: 4Fe-4S dicluster domain-containing protein [candidate division WOR-3 bacterium]|nr:4Fe-4S dicluster domain-containing protein [candidate division WOR-3 bacterium]